MEMVTSIVYSLDPGNPTLAQELYALLKTDPALQYLHKDGAFEQERPSSRYTGKRPLKSLSRRLMPKFGTARNFADGLKTSDRRRNIVGRHLLKPVMFRNKRYCRKEEFSIDRLSVPNLGLDKSTIESIQKVKQAESILTAAVSHCSGRLDKISRVITRGTKVGTYSSIIPKSLDYIIKTGMWFSFY